MIAQVHRFHGRASIQRLYTNSRLARSGALGLRYAQNPRRRSYRAAVVVSRKISKSAVIRNRIRRRLYEHVRILSDSLPAPYDLLLTVYDEKLATLPPDELASEVAKVFHKAKLTAQTPARRDIVKAKES